MTPDASLPPADVQRTTDKDAWCACGHEWAEDHQVPAAGGNFSSWCRICGVNCSADVQRPTPPLTDESTLIAALKQFGWEGGPEFFKRYYSDPWVFNLANAVERLSAEVERLRADFHAVRTTLNQALADMQAVCRDKDAEVERLREAVSGVIAAIHVEGRSPAHHRKVMGESRLQWPALWRALDRLVDRA